MFRSRFSAFACSTRRADRASRRCLANTASSVNTMAPPTVMLSASIVVVNHVGMGGGIGPSIDARDPRAQEHHHPGDEPARRIADIAEHERGQRGEDSPEPDATRAEEATQRDHRECRREQDVDLADPEQQPEVARSRERQDRAEQDGEVDQRHDADRRAEREVQRAPQRRHRQDQDGDQDEQRLPSAQVVVVSRVGADARQATDHGFGRRAESGARIHARDGT